MDPGPPRSGFLRQPGQPGVGHFADEQEMDVRRQLVQRADQDVHALDGTHPADEPRHDGVGGKAEIGAGGRDVRRAVVPGRIVALVDPRQLRRRDPDLVAQIRLHGIRDADDVGQAGMQVGQPGGRIPAAEVAGRAAVADDAHGRPPRGHQGYRQRAVVLREQQIGRTGGEAAPQRGGGLEIQAVADGEEADVGKAFADGVAAGAGRIDQELDVDARLPEPLEQGDVGAVDRRGHNQ